MSKEDIVLLIADGATGPFGLDPVRMMKGCVVAAERGPEEWSELFSFRAYDWGPFDSTVYRARDALIARGLLDVDGAHRYERYSVTADGARCAHELSDQDPERAAWLRSVGEYVSSKSFSQLLREIYDAYPQYATRSRFVG